MKYFISLVLLTFIFSTLSHSQVFFTGRQVITFTDASRGNRQISTEVYYPANSAGNNVPLALGTGKFPVVVFGHGFVIPVASYSWLADSLVKYGYIVAMPTTEGSLSPSHDNFGKDLAFLCTTITALDNDASSFLYQRVKNKAAVAGHSMGGGCSFLAASGNSPANVIFNFSAAETNPSATAAASQTSKPALIFSGSSDCIVAPSVQQSMYNNVNFSCKTYININGALHCQFANNNGICVFGQLTSGCNSSTVTPAIVFNKVTYLLLPFLDFYLKDICIRGDDFLNAYATITGVSKLTGCTAFPACGVLPVNLLKFYGTATGKVASLAWDVSTEFNLLKYVVEKSNDGSIFKSFTEELPKGPGSHYSASDLFPYPGFSYYRLKIPDKDGNVNYSSVIKVKTKESDIGVTGFYPNPVNDNLNVQLFAVKKQTISFGIIGMQGQNILAGNTFMKQGDSDYKILLKTLPAGSYFLKLTDEKHQPISTIKFIKE